MLPPQASIPPKSRFLGVFWDKARQKWFACLGAEGKTHKLGRFCNEIEAAKAYDDAAREAHGVFARLNFPTPAERERAAEFVDRKEARRMFAISLPAWKRWEKAGLIRGIRTSYRVFYRVKELERLLPGWGPVEPPRPDPDRPGCYRVPLSARRPFRTRDEAIVDADALAIIEGKRCFWSRHEDGSGYIAVGSESGGEPLHRVILGITDENLQINHANGDPLDCRRENLVVRTIQERTWSSKKRRHNGNGRPCLSRFKGVSWVEREGRWKVRITVDGKEHSLGRFDDEVEAAEAYDDAAREHFGEHAWLNFPGAGERGFAEHESAPTRVAA